MASLRRGGTFVDVKEEVPEYAKKIDHGAKVEAVVSALVKVETPDRREIRRMKAEAVEPAGVKVETHEIRRMKAEEGGASADEAGEGGADRHRDGRGGEEGRLAIGKWHGVR